MGELILAVETSTRFANVALVDAAGGPVAHRSTTPDEGRPLAELVLACVGDRWGDVQAYAIGVGPGSFTGLRVGLALLKGVAAARPRPVVPVSSLAAWAQSLDDVDAARVARERWVVLDARRSQVWAGCYRVGPRGLVEPVQPDFRTSLFEVRAQIVRSDAAVVGTAAGLLLDPGGAGEGDHARDASRRDTPPPVRGGNIRDFASAVPRPSAVHLARLARRAAQEGAVVGARDVAPNYLMASAAEEKLGIDADRASER
jgi:tRNA threonylcarbamoyladenosine biosynthesis protein TsaB